MSLLSVVIITKNEERNIAKAITSVQKAVSNFHNTKILIVDSASTDKTIDIAKEYPVQIICLDALYFLSPAAGRFIGLQHCHSEYVFFLDGDMILEESWFENALPVLQNNPQLAGIAGKCQEFIYNDKGELIQEVEDRFNADQTSYPLFSLGGSVLYRRSVLLDVGGFNPYLANEEELELGLRICKAGFLLQRISVPMTVHFTRYYSNENPSGLTIRQLRRDLKMGRYEALGKVFRLLLNNPLKIEFLKRYNKGLMFLGFYCIGILSVFTNQFHIWLSVLAGAFVLRVLWKQHLFDTLLFFLEHSLVAYGFLWGFLKPTPLPKNYSPQLEFINYVE